MLLGSCLTTVSASTDEIPAENKYALLCASTTFLYLLDYPEAARGACIENYGEIAPAENATYAIRDTLIDDYGWLPNHITILLNEDNTKANIIQGINSLKQYDSPDTLFFMFFCGHGWVMEDEDGDEAAYPSIGDRQGKDPWDECWQPYDGIPGGQGKATNYVNFIRDDEFKMLLADFQGKLVVQFFSCCGSGLIEDMAGPNRLALGTGDSDRLEMHWWPVDFYYWHALMGCTGAEFPEIDLDMNPDINGDGKISVEESYNWAVAANEATDITVVGWGGGPVGLYMVDGIEGETFL